MSSEEQKTSGYKRRSSGKRRRSRSGSADTAAVAAVAEKEPVAASAAPTAASAAASSGSRESRADAKARAIAEAEAEKGRPSLTQRMVNTDRFEGIRRFIRDTWAEIKKVIWPDRETTRNLTLLVIALSIVLGILLGGLDYILFELFEALP